MSVSDESSRDGGFRLDTFLPYRLSVVTDGIANVFADSYDRGFKLSIPEWRVLATVAAHGTLSPTVVGRRTAMDKVKVSRAAQSLIGKGMVRQSQDPRDGRGRLLRLTRKGTVTYEGMVPLATKLESDVFGTLSRSEITAFNRVLTKLATRIEMNGLGGDGPEDEV